MIFILVLINLIKFCSGQAPTFNVLDWNEQGVARNFYNEPANLGWTKASFLHKYDYNYNGKPYTEVSLGDWFDSASVHLGNSSFDGVTTIRNGDGNGWVDFTCTSLVNLWLLPDGPPNHGMLLRALSITTSYGPNYLINFYSKEAPSNQPQLHVVDNSGTQHTLGPIADTFLNVASYSPYSHEQRLRLQYASAPGKHPQHSLVRFDLSTISGPVQSATLRLYKYEQFGGGSVDVGIFRLQSGLDYEDPRDIAPQLGAAAAHPRDDAATLMSDPQILFVEQFDKADWGSKWSQGSSDTHLTRLVTDDGKDPDFEPFDGEALRCEIVQGDHYGMSLKYNFVDGDKLGFDPLQASFRYYVRLGGTWNMSTEIGAMGGKMPGFGGLYNGQCPACANADGTKGYSCRGGYSPSLSSANVLGAVTPLHSILVDVDPATQYGKNPKWLRNGLGLLQKNRWYSIEQFIKMNSINPTANDGVLKVWIDGKLAYEQTDIVFRTVDQLKVKSVWFNIYHGGFKPSPITQHIYFDNIVVSKSGEYIGPIVSASGQTASPTPVAGMATSSPSPPPATPSPTPTLSPGETFAPTPSPTTPNPTSPGQTQAPTGNDILGCLQCPCLSGGGCNSPQLECVDSFCLAVQVQEGVKGIPDSILFAIIGGAVGVVVLAVIIGAVIWTQRARRQHQIDMFYAMQQRSNGQRSRPSSRPRSRMRSQRSSATYHSQATTKTEFARVPFH